MQNGAIDFLLGLPPEANSMVVAAGGEPQVVAPLNARRADALSAISALEVGGSRATSAATRLAAESLQSGPPGPRVIVVYTHGPDENGPSVEQLSEAVLQADAVVNVIPAGAESIWPSVVERTGGVVLPPTGAADIAQSYGRLATMLSEQYLVTFQAPGELPAVAQVAFQSGDQEYSTVVNLPDADTEQAAPTEGRGIAGLVSLVVAGLVLIGLAVLALVLRTRRQASVQQPAGRGGWATSQHTARPGARSAGHGGRRRRSAIGWRPGQHSGGRAGHLAPTTTVPARVTLGGRAGTQVGRARPQLSARTAGPAPPGGPAATTRARGESSPVTCTRGWPSTRSGQRQCRDSTADTAIQCRATDRGASRRSPTPSAGRGRAHRHHTS